MLNRVSSQEGVSGKVGVAASNLAPGVLAAPGVYIVSHQNPSRTVPHKIRITTQTILPECNECRGVRFSFECPFPKKIEECEFFGRRSLSYRPERTLEIHCDNCQARFVAWYGTEEDAETEAVDVEKCGLCGGDSFKKDVSKDTVIRLMSQVTARNVKRD